MSAAGGQRGRNESIQSCGGDLGEAGRGDGAEEIHRIHSEGIPEIRKTGELFYLTTASTSLLFFLEDISLGGDDFSNVLVLNSQTYFSNWNDIIFEKEKMTS